MSFKDHLKKRMQKIQHSLNVIEPHQDIYHNEKLRKVSQKSIRTRKSEGSNLYNRVELKNSQELALNNIQTRISEKNTKLSKLQLKLHSKLTGKHFRLLNEQLFNLSDTQTIDYFDSNPTIFYSYHNGFKEQVSSWPFHPVSILIQFFLKIYSDKIRDTDTDLLECITHIITFYSKDHSQSYSKIKKSSQNSIISICAKSPIFNTLPHIVIADLGCGEALLAQSLYTLPFYQVHSIDVLSVNHFVTKANISNTNLDSSSIDFAIFCLSLMTKFYNKYIIEANRILKQNGILIIVDIEKRFSTVESFIDQMRIFGFSCIFNATLSLFSIMFYLKVDESGFDTKCYLKGTKYKNR